MSNGHAFVGVSLVSVACSLGMLIDVRMSASLIGCLGQARFPFFFWVFVTHPGHASLRSLFDVVMAPLVARDFR
jgi:hypothetical protein